MEPGSGTREDALLGGRLRLRQSRGGHRAGTDALLLAAAAPDTERFCDLGCGVGTVGLAVALAQPAAAGVLLDDDPDALVHAQANVALNGLTARLEVRQAEVGALADAAGQDAGRFDLVLTNPPFYSVGASRPSPDPARRRAHEESVPLALWLRAAWRLLAPSGRLLVIHRAEAVPALLDAMPGDLAALSLRFVHPRADAPAGRVLLGAKRGSRAPLSVLAPVVLHGADGRFTALGEAVSRGEARLTFSRDQRQTRT